MDWLVLVFLLIAIILIAIVIIADYWGRTGTQGRPCSEGCVDPYICDSTTQTCRLKPGSRCMSDEECTSNAKCSGAVCVINTSQSTKSQPLPEASSTNETPCTNNTESYNFELDSNSYELDYTYSNSNSPKISYSQSSSRMSVQSSSQIYQEDSYSQSLFEDLSFLHSSSNSEEDKIRDIISHNDDVITLTASGDISINNGNRKPKVNVIVDSLESFNGNIYCVSEGRFLLLDKKTYDKENWSFIHTKVGLRNITHTSITLDGSHIWIQNDSTGQLLNKKLSKQGSLKVDFRRIMGDNKNKFVDCYDSGKIILNNNEVITEYNDIYSACFNNEGNLVVAKIGKTDPVKKIRIINAVAHNIYA